MFPKIVGVSPQIIPCLIGFSIINHPFWGTSTPIFGNIHLQIFISATEPAIWNPSISFWNLWPSYRTWCTEKNRRRVWLQENFKKIELLLSLGHLSLDRNSACYATPLLTNRLFYEPRFGQPLTTTCAAWAQRNPHSGLLQALHWLSRSCLTGKRNDESVAANTQDDSKWKSPKLIFEKGTVTPPWKLTYPLKIDGCNMEFLFYKWSLKGAETFFLTFPIRFFRNMFQLSHRGDL